MNAATKLLDVGCGDGQYALHQGWPTEYDYYGIDIDKSRIAAARRRGLDVSRGDVVHGLPYDNGEFDRVVAKAVLEHVADPLTAAQECQRVLRVGGQFDAIVPSDRSYDLWGDYSHRRGFRRDALSDLLADAGFRQIRIQPRMGWTSIGMALQSLYRIAAPWTPYGFPRAWHAQATIHEPFPGGSRQG